MRDGLLTMKRDIDNMLLLGHISVLLPFAAWIMDGFVGDFRNYNDDLAGYTGAGQVIHGGEWMFPWSTPICLTGGIVALIIGCKRRKIIPIIEGLWCCLAAYLFFVAYPIYVRFI